METTTLPPLRDDLALLPAAPEADGSPVWTVFDPVRNRYFRIGRVAFELLSRWGLGEAGRLLGTLDREGRVRVEAADLEALLRFLQANNLLRGDAPGMAETYRRQSAAGRRHWLHRLIHGYLFFRIPLVRPDRLLARTGPWLEPLYSGRFALLLAAVGVVGLFLALRQWDTFTTTFLDLFSWTGVGAWIVTLLGVKTIHELGHAYTARRYGCRVPTMGVAFLVMWPVLYTDASDAWRLTSRRRRLAIGAAGMVAELGLATIALFLWSFLPDGPARTIAFLVATTSWVMSLAVNLNPFMRFDGYYLLADWLGVENLQERAFALGRWRLRELLFGVGAPPPEAFPPGRRRLLVAYAWGTWLYRFFLFLGIALLVYHLFFKLLGLVLFAVEIVWFIGLPIWREVASWRHAGPRLNRRSLLTGALLAGALAAAAIPWHGRVELPALLKAADHTVVYPPIAARLEAVHVAEGERVEAGQPLFELEAPDLRFELAQVEREIELLDRLIDRQAAHHEDLARIHVLYDQRATKAAERSGLTERLAALRVTAPFAGVVTDLTDALEKGRWLAEDQALARLLAPDRAELVGYLEGDALERLSVGASARFYPDDPLRSPVDARVEVIEISALPALDQRYLASTYGGPIAVREVEGERLVPERAFYRVRLVPTSEARAPTQVVRGIAVAQGESASLIQRLWRAVAAVAIRESGF